MNSQFSNVAAVGEHTDVIVYGLPRVVNSVVEPYLAIVADPGVHVYSLPYVPPDEPATTEEVNVVPEVDVTHVHASPDATGRSRTPVTGFRFEYSGSVDFGQ
eukprot:30294-Pelagococcus_subviridis.AAC.104